MTVHPSHPGARQRITPAPGQESVWDYPRPPRLEASDAEIEVVLGGVVVARTAASLRVLETSHPPVHYLPLDAFVAGALHPVGGSSWCEFKGAAAYYDVVAHSEDGSTVVAPRAGWTYPDPTPGFEALRDRVALMPAAMERITLAGEVVVPQEGGFYGGWITSAVVGPFKGPPGTRGW